MHSEELIEVIRQTIREELRAVRDEGLDRLLNTNEAAKILKVHPITLCKQRSVGQGPDYIDISNKDSKRPTIRYKLSAIKRYQEKMGEKA